MLLAFGPVLCIVGCWAAFYTRCQQHTLSNVPKGAQCPLGTGAIGHLWSAAQCHPFPQPQTCPKGGGSQVSHFRWRRDLVFPIICTWLCVGPLLTRQSVAVRGGWRLSLASLVMCPHGRAWGKLWYQMGGRTILGGENGPLLHPCVELNAQLCCHPLNNKLIWQMPGAILSYPIPRPPSEGAQPFFKLATWTSPGRRWAPIGLQGPEVLTP